MDLPLLERYQGVKRFEMMVRLLDGDMLRRSRAGQDLEVRRRYCQRLEEELKMARDDLKAELATRYETAALGVALKKLSVSLDDNLKDFNNSARDAIAQTQQRA